jgi:hypothetical protein
LELEVFWSRLQKIVQSDPKFYAVLQDAKTQLDFAVSFWWWSAASSLSWLIWLAFNAYSFAPFIVVATVGPFLAWLSYKIAILNYSALAELLRSALDLFRFDLLTALHIPLPSGAEDESKLWESLTKRTAYGERVDIAFTR